VQTKDLTAVFMIFAMAAGFATASQATECGTDCSGTGTSTGTDGGGGDPETKGDNGWGNGADGVNPGTDNGNARQVSTKENTNPPQYDADKVERFGGR
jgi:hypothetical protein